MQKPESEHELRRRIMVVTACAVEARRLVDTELKGYHFTLLVFDLGGPGAVAFVMTYPASVAIATIEPLIKHWKSGAQTRFIQRPPPGAPQPITADELIAARDAIEAHLPGALGFSLFVGEGELVQYISKGEREGIIEMLTKEVLPNWKRDFGL